MIIGESVGICKRVFSFFVDFFLDDDFFFIGELGKNICCVAMGLNTHTPPHH